MASVLPPKSHEETPATNMEKFLNSATSATVPLAKLPNGGSHTSKRKIQ